MPSISLVLVLYKDESVLNKFPKLEKSLVHFSGFVALSI